jgi:hypothetical protein
MAEYMPAFLGLGSNGSFFMAARMLSSVRRVVSILGVAVGTLVFTTPVSTPGLAVTVLSVVTCACIGLLQQSNKTNNIIPLIYEEKNRCILRMAKLQ